MIYTDTCCLKLIGLGCCVLTFYIHKFCTSCQHVYFWQCYIIFRFQFYLLFRQFNVEMILTANNTKESMIQNSNMSLTCECHDLELWWCYFISFILIALSSVYSWYASHSKSHKRVHDSNSNMPLSGECHDLELWWCYFIFNLQF